VIRAAIVLVALVASACRVAPPARPADHPASASAPGGRLAGPPPILAAPAPGQP